MRRAPIGVLGLCVVVMSAIAFVAGASAATRFLAGAGPDIGLFDVADGHHAVGFQVRGMIDFGAGEGHTSFRLDGSYTHFAAEDENSPYDEGALLANLVLAGTRP